MNLFIDDGVGLFISMNSAGKEGASGRIRGALFEDFADRYFPGEAEHGELDAKTAAEHARMIAGGYDISRRMENNFFSVLNLMGQIKVAVNEDGTITVPLMTNPSGVPLKWREISPFLWREVGGKQLLSAQVDEGRVTRFSFEPLSAIMVFEPTPGYKSGLWLGPLSIVALVALLLTTLAWPVAALTRRHYRAAYALTGQDALAHRRVRIAALAATALSIAWLLTVTLALQKLSSLGGGLDWWFWLLQIASLVVYIGAAAIGLWNAWNVLRSKRSWYAKTWAVVLAVSFLTLLWVALAYDLIAFDLRY